MSSKTRAEQVMTVKSHCRDYHAKFLHSDIPFPSRYLMEDEVIWVSKPTSYQQSTAEWSLAGAVRIKVTQFLAPWIVGYGQSLVLFH